RIQDVALWFYSLDNRHYWYKVKYSTDGVIWNYLVGDPSTWVKSKPGYVINGSYRNASVAEKFHNATGIYMRYLRVYGDGNSRNTGNHLYELAVSSSNVGVLIDGNGIVANSITADHLSVASLSAISSNLGTIEVGTANIAKGAITTAKIGDLQVDTLRI